MKIGIQTWGSEGDVRPLLALAAGLRAAGHDVTLAISHIENRDYAPLGETFGVRVRTVGRTDLAALARTGQALIDVTNPIAQIRLITRELFEPLASDMFEAARALCRENDLVIGHLLVHPLQAAAEEAGVPRVAVFLAPLLPSRVFPPIGMPDLGGILNGLLWRLGSVIMDRMFLPPIAALRKRAGLPAVRSVLQDVLLSKELNLVGVSPALFPRPADWTSNVHLCGAFSLPRQGAGQELSPELRRFLDAGPPPVYLTFGSMSAADPGTAETAEMMLASARLAGCRAIIQYGTADILPSDDLFVINGPAPHDLIFPRCAAVVHHGGSGTTQAASRAGCPSVVVPHATDQAFWADLLHRRGIAPPPLDRRRATAERLAAAVRSVLASRAMQERARAVGAAMAAEDGVKRAVGLIEERYGGKT